MRRSPTISHQLLTKPNLPNHAVTFPRPLRRH
ncbi:hypothetical protein AAHA92_22009 [Salvia divinorum]|uniref:Uncharacterized protein n=1 Tax=Salvia divinorum TaxID=28513 RepID=A0ABD1GMA1_SALDI